MSKLELHIATWAGIKIKPKRNCRKTHVVWSHL